MLQMVNLLRQKKDLDVSLPLLKYDTKRIIAVLKDVGLEDPMDCE